MPLPAPAKLSRAPYGSIMAPQRPLGGISGRLALAALLLVCACSLAHACSFAGR